MTLTLQQPSEEQAEAELEQTESEQQQQQEEEEAEEESLSVQEEEPKPEQDAAPEADTPMDAAEQPPVEAKVLSGSEEVLCGSSPLPWSLSLFTWFTPLHCV